MHKPAYGLAEVMKWKADLDRDMPPPPDTGPEARAYALTSFSIQPARDGLLISVRTSLNQTVTFSINPVLAQNLLEQMVDAGVAGGWMDGSGVILPPRDG